MNLNSVVLRISMLNFCHNFCFIEVWCLRPALQTVLIFWICQDIFLTIKEYFPFCPLFSSMTHPSSAIKCVLETRQECQISASNSKIIPSFQTRVSRKFNVNYFWNDYVHKNYLSSSLKEVTYIESMPSNVNNSHVRRFSHNKFCSNTD